MKLRQEQRRSDAAVDAGTGEGARAVTPIELLP